MAQLPIDEAIVRFKDNEDKFDTFVNLDGTYTTNEVTPRTVQTLPSFMDEMISRYYAYSAKGAWTTATAYEKQDLVVEGGVTYLCLLDHTSATFATDLSSGKWVVYQGLTRDELASSDAGKGAELVEYQGDTVEDALDKRIPEIGNYASLDAYTGSATTVRVYGVQNIFDGGHGIFSRTTDTPSNANGIYRQDGLGRWWKREIAGQILLEWFEAKGDGITDDTLHLREWLSSEGGEHVITSTNKTYIVKPQVVGEVILALTSPKVIIGNGAKIKVANTSGGFYAILGSSSTSIDLSGTKISGLVFDHNKSNNTYTASSNVLTNPHFTFSALNGSDIEFCGNRVIDPVCTNSVYLNGVVSGVATVLRPKVKGNAFIGVGGSATAHDHSTIYVTGDDAEVSGNFGSSHALGTTGAACFIELHSTRILAFGNRGYNFDGFMNMTGIYSGGDTENSQIFGNIGVALQFGIRCFSTTSGVHTTGYGINGVDIFNNRIRIKQNQLPSGTNRGYLGIGVQSGSTLPIKDLRIYNNSVEYDVESVAPSYTAVSGAVGVMESSNNTVFEGIEIATNTITNAPGPAVILGFSNGTFKNCIIGNNTLKNAGQSLAAGMSAYKAGVWLGGNLYSGMLKINDLNIIDDQSVTRLQFGVYATPVSDSSACTVDVNANITLTGDGVSFLRGYANVGNKTLPVFRCRINKAPLFTSHTFKVGSEIQDISNDLTYKIQVQGSTWTDHGYATTTPVSGTHQVGSTRTNTAPAAGGTPGWVCVTAGNPGTWKAMANLAA